MPRKKINTNFGGVSFFFWAYRYQIMQGMSLKIPTTGWHLTSHCLASELPVVAVGADLVHTWNCSLTMSATDPRDHRTCPKATTVSSSTPTGLGIGSHVQITRVGIASSGSSRVGTSIFPTTVASSSLSPVVLRTTTSPGRYRGSTPRITNGWLTT